MKFRLTFHLISLVLSLMLFSYTHTTYASSVEAICEEISGKLRTIKKAQCLDFQLSHSSIYSVQNRALTYKEILPDGVYPKGRILYISGIHGDEYSAFSLSYLWLQTLLQQEGAIQYHWLFLPFANPDGLMKSPATRTNANGVDLNRNFPSPDWDEIAMHHWKQHSYKQNRRYPGPFANSEPETQWIVGLIEQFQPDVIISMHAPYGLLDYDGPEYAQPDQIGHLKLRPLGTYPGSLGRYAGEYLKIPVLTVELKSANSLPSQQEIDTMFADLKAWINDKIERQETDF